MIESEVLMLLGAVRIPDVDDVRVFGDAGYFPPAMPAIYAPCVGLLMVHVELPGTVLQGHETKG